MVTEKQKQKEHEFATKLKAQHRKAKAKAKRHAKRPKVPEGEIDYKWCDFDETPTVIEIMDEEDNIMAIYVTGKIKGVTTKYKVF